MEQLSFDIFTTKGDKQFKITKKQVVVLLECLWDFKLRVKEVKTDNQVRIKNLEHKSEEIEKIFNILQDTIGYDFEKHLGKCNKKVKEDDPGMEAFSWLNNREGKDEV